MATNDALLLLGFPTTSTAPSSNALMLASAPALVRVEIITTGIGRNCMIRRKNSKPSICGISMSSVNTSGCNCLIFSRASIGSSASPTTSNNGCDERISRNIRRINMESSTISTFFIFYLFYNISHRNISLLK